MAGRKTIGTMKSVSQPHPLNIRVSISLIGRENNGGFGNMERRRG